MKELVLPPNKKGVGTVKTTRSIICVGANGSGKSRMGALMEEIMGSYAHRISAQKSLSFPTSVSLRDIALLKSILLNGDDARIPHREDPMDSDFRAHYRWGDEPATHLLNDYTALVTYLLSDHASDCVEYANNIEEHGYNKIGDPKNTKIKRIQNIWEQIIPHRKLIIESASVKVGAHNADGVYNAAEMSDGERVVFYLIGQCLAAPENGVIIIDEPELHLHKSIQWGLWAAIEKERADCMFVYFTHDVDFAAAAEGVPKVWIKDYDGNHSWEWEEIAEIDTFPTALLLEILGNRKPVVFVEGDNGSAGAALYRAILSDFLIIPSGSCQNVIQYTKAMRANAQTNHLDICGIIDRDKRTDAEITQLQQENIFTLAVAEVGNLFCTPEMLMLFYQDMNIKEEESEFIERVTSFAFDKLKHEIEAQIMLRVQEHIQQDIRGINTAGKNKGAVRAELQKGISDIKVDQIYTEYQQMFNAILNNRDYGELLKYYNRESLSQEISRDCGEHDLPQCIVDLAMGNKHAEIQNALQGYFGGFFEAAKKDAEKKSAA